MILDDAEIDLLAERNANVAHCLSNNMKLAKCVTRVPDLLAAGVNVYLEVDMMSDMHTEMRPRAALVVAAFGNPSVFTSRDLLPNGDLEPPLAPSPPTAPPTWP
ncbi:MAG: amidohydrolase family protein [bacterium]|nr:amidohydrolase family protein [bacterium]MDE0352242.1 amidohydrolase family protein [bacterium]